uniref:Uncharacterized protein n=1 Tax=Amphimedon queenslandica TaxID=400682 RepID=I1EYX8_AMPQE
MLELRQSVFLRKTACAHAQ